ncbi:hypothetical protein K466DRAFT_496815 [Polyporus arcularius HHB13444]|uniref:Uncharacterized protein n=1 Tax=Polyporus arcularius HHB13444 TaxID=1314778 RepID=A0A5C3P7U8_9APHY|nr:hypothetical protein K466DRAFT_496815 [Polyporus arcularius HHB13444]
MAEPVNPYRVTVEEVEDVEAGGLPRRPWAGEYPEDARVGAVLRDAHTIFEALREKRRAAGEGSFAPFESREEWDLAKWLVTSGLSQDAIDEYLTLPIVRKIQPDDVNLVTAHTTVFQTRDRTQVSFKNKYAFLKKVDGLPGGAQWLCDEWEIVGDVKDEEGNVKVEEVELWRRDPVECIRELIGNPDFKDHLKYAPEKLFVDKEGTGRMYDEMWTGDWWWDVQSELPQGSTVAPIILSSDKTQLSRFSGDKQAWPVYLSIGNISKDIRRQPSKRATILVGYIPVTKLECFAKGPRRSLEGYRLFHECMKTILQPLVDAANAGVEMTCADGGVRRVHPIVAAYVADHPEQCLVSGCQENFCPKCGVHSSNLGLPVYSVMKDQSDVWSIIEEQARGEKPTEFKELGLRLIDPFWRALPYCDIFSCITPDLLHQLHKGVFKDHTVSWTTECLEGGAEELDRRFKAMPSHPALRHFKKGISLVTQWTGTEYKQMEKVFAGAITGAADADTLRAVRAVLDFIFYAHFHAHTDDSLARLEAAWATFHQYKEVFVRHGVREHFNIPKLHSALHYALSIRKLGTTDGYNTETSERLHIDYAKRGYAASNKRAYIKQMATWLNRQEAVYRFDRYLAWAEPVIQTSAGVLDEDAEEGGGVDRMEVDGTAAGEHDSLPYVIAKTPGLPGTSVQQLVREFGCTDFVPALEDFLRKSCRSRQLPAAAQHINARTRFAVYRRMAVHLPPLRQVSRKPIKDTIRAVPAQRARPLCPSSPAHFDTVLARELPAEEYDPLHPLEGLSVARVRAIFRLPEAYGRQFKHPVAFVEWFTSLRGLDPDTGMFKVSKSTRNHRRRVSIIPITQIQQSCHLIPVWGKRIDPTWNSRNVLDKASRFYVNPYLRDHDFVLLRYLQDK